VSPGAAFVAELDRGPGDPELLPERLARACVAALPVDGAGLSHAFDPDRRLPLGASDAQAVAAEQMQFALGDGPCLEAQRRRRPLAVSAPELAQRWPVYASQLAARTAYRSVLAVPVGGPLAAVTTLDLFCTDAEAPAVPDEDVAEVALLVGDALAADMSGGQHRLLGLPDWFHRPAVLARQRVWLAVAQLSGQDGISNAAALAVLRARAFRLDQDLETAAEGLLRGEVPPA
ncbi:GAF-like domain superfamily protein, partial [Klenkia terrae]